MAKYTATVSTTLYYTTLNETGEVVNGMWAALYAGEGNFTYHHVALRSAEVQAGKVADLYARASALLNPEWSAACHAEVVRLGIDLEARDAQGHRLYNIDINIERH